MKTKNRFGSIMSALLVTGLWAANASAAPTALASPPALTSGFQVDWVETSVSPHSIANALDTLNGTNGFTTVNSATQYLSTINLTDASVPFSDVADPLFAIRVSGFITIATAGEYQFFSWHDDGIRVTLGGEQIITYDGDTGIMESDSSVYNLAAGVYAFETISWEQGGVFDLQLGIADVIPGVAVTPVALVGEHAAAVPEPMSLALVGMGLFGLAGARRKRN